MSSRTKAILGTAITVLVLAGVFFIGWSLSSSRNTSQPTPVTVQLSPAQQSQKDYEEGARALSNGDTRTAQSFFQKAVELDPNNTAAQQALASTKPAPPPVATSTPTPSKPKGADPFLKAVSDINKLLPKSFPDYSLGTRQKIGSDTSRTGTANKSGALASNITWEVHDRKSAPGATTFIKKVSMVAWRKNATSVTVRGYSGYFGTDGAHFATIAVARGRYAFDVILTSAGGPPSGLKSLALQAANAFPAAP